MFKEEEAILFLVFVKSISGLDLYAFFSRLLCDPICARSDSLFIGSTLNIA